MFATPVKMLIVTTTADTLRAFLLPFARHFRARGWHVDALALGATSCSDCREAFDGCFEAPWSRALSNIAGILKSQRAILNAVEQERYQIVHVHTPIAAFVTRWTLRRRPRQIRVVYTAHGFHFHKGGTAAINAIYRSIERLAASWTDYLVVINREDHDVARELRLVPSNRLRYMPGIGIDLEHFSCTYIPSGEVEEFRYNLGLTTGVRLFLMVAEFNPGKRHRDAVEALALIGRADFHMAFAGLGPELERVRSLAERLGVSSQVHFLGFRTDVPKLLRAATALVLPSEREGLPRSIMEAMAMGIPVIGADVRGIRDLVESGAGVLVPVGNTQQLAAAMSLIGTDASAASEFARRGLHQIQRCGLQRILAAHEELYSDALAEMESPPVAAMEGTDP